MAYFGVIFFALIWGVGGGGQNCFHPSSRQPISMSKSDKGPLFAETLTLCWRDTAFRGVVRGCGGGRHKRKKGIILWEDWHAISASRKRWDFENAETLRFLVRSPKKTQAALKGTNLRGQTEPKRRFSLIFADSRLFLENEAFGKRRFSQKTADFRRKPLIFAGNRRNRRLAFVPLGSSP